MNKKTLWGLSGYGGGIFLRTNPPNNANDVGNIYIKHCYFENNNASNTTGSPDNSGIGRGMLFILFFMYLFILFYFYFYF
jgi:hypothetical protein